MGYNPRGREGWHASMRWIRSNIHGFARLALFAMAVQVIVTFGHVHLDGLVPASARGGQSVADQALTPSAKKAQDQDRKSPGTADRDCPICALIQLASTSAPAVAPPLPIPASLGGTILEAPNVSGATASPTFAFQARAPPAI